MMLNEEVFLINRLTAMYKYLIFLMACLLISCSSNNKNVPIKFVNHSIPAQDAKVVFSVDSDYCVHKVLKDRPYVYKDCKYYTNPAMRKNCLNENSMNLSSFKKSTQKLYIHCLKERGWQEEVFTKNVSVLVEGIERVAPIYPVEAISLCVVGKVKVGFTIAKDGSVKNVNILEAKPVGIFDNAVINAVSAWRFKPIMANGELIEQYIVQELMFEPYESCGQKIKIPAQ